MYLKNIESKRTSPPGALLTVHVKLSSARGDPFSERAFSISTGRSATKQLPLPSFVLPRARSLTSLRLTFHVSQIQLSTSQIQLGRGGYK